MKETDVGAAAVAMFREQGFTCWQEVLTRRHGCLDLAATRNESLIAVECKMRPTLDLFHQTLMWQPHAERCYAAALVGDGGLHYLAERLLKDLGLGFISVFPLSTGLVAEVTLDARLNPHADDDLRDALREEHKTYAPAGSQGTARWSPYKATCADLRAYVEAHPGCLLTDAVLGIRHHYGTPSRARSSLTEWLDKGAIAGVRLERVNGRLTLHPSTKPPRSA